MRWTFSGTFGNSFRQALKQPAEGWVAKREKINKLHKPKPDGAGGNDLYRRFKKAFDVLLSPQNPAIQRQEFDDWHVSTPHLEDELASASDNLRDSIRFLLGPTGIGKSTLVRYVFKLSQAPIIRDRTLFVPVFFNNRRPHDHLFDAVIRVCSRRLTQKFSKECSVDALHEFIDQNRPDLLDMDAIASAADNAARLTALREGNPFAYEMERLKFFLRHSDIERVVLIVDDIESLKHDHQEALILNVCRAFACLENEENRNYTLSFFISCRPSTHGFLRRKDWYSVYAFDDPIAIERAVDLSSIFKARFDSAVRVFKLSPDPAKRQNWQLAYDVLMRLAEIVSDRYHLSIIQLCNNNMRQGLTEFQRILTNRTWFQRNRAISPSFTIDDSDYAVTEAAIYRALAVRNGRMYPGFETPVANLLWNTENEASDLLITYVIRYLLTAANGGQDGVGVQGIQMVADLSVIFPSIGEDTTDLENVMQYMTESRLIERDDVDNVEYLNLTPRADMLWRMLQSNSICLEFFRDGTYLDFEDGEFISIQELRYEARFIALSKLITNLTRIERRHIEECRTSLGGVALFIKRFGKRLLTRYLLGGVATSAKLYFTREGGIPPDVKNGLKQNSVEIAENERLLGAPEEGDLGGAI